MMCLMIMWRTSRLCTDGLRGFGLVISVLKISPWYRPTTKIDDDELKAAVEELRMKCPISN